MKKSFLFLPCIYFLLTSGYLFSQDSMNVRLLFHWNDTSIINSGSPHYNVYNEVWGFVQNGNEYAVIGSTMGTHIFDITNIDSSYQAAFISGAAQGTGIVHRDYKSFQNYLYIVCDEGASTLQIADVSYLPDSAPLVYNSNALFTRSHNIYIDTSTAKMYVCGGSYQLEVYSLANPVNPVRLLRCPLDIPWWGTVGYVHDAYSRNDTLYCNAEGRGLFVVDFSNIANPQLIGSLTDYTDKGYNHSGWMNEAGNIYAFADETHGMSIKICNISDLQDITEVRTVNSNVAPTSIPHNLIIRGNFMYVSYYFDGLYIWDIANPSAPVLAGYYDTSTIPAADGLYRGAWGVFPNLPSGKVLLSDMQNGLFIFDVSAATGIKNVEQQINNSIHTYPNPCADFLYISATGKSNYPEYELYDFTGKIIMSGKISGSNERLQMKNIPSGIYLLKLSGNNFSEVKKLVKTE